MTDATRSPIPLVALLVGILAAGWAATYQRHQKMEAIHQAAVLEGEVRAAKTAETVAKADRASAQHQVAQRDIEVAQLRQRLAAHPAPPPAAPVPIDAPASMVIAGLTVLGLHPQPAAEHLAVGLNLPDGREVLSWGREALRAPGLQARMTDLEQLSAAQEARAQAQAVQQGATDRALEAADARADAQGRRAEVLQSALQRQPTPRAFAAGVLVGVDPSGIRRAGAFATASWGYVQVQVLYLNQTAAVGAAIRF